MTKKPKLLWCGDIVAMTGFARVTENVISRLKDDFEIVVLGHNWWGDPTPLQATYVMYPSSNRHQQEPFGVQRIREVIEKEKPDVVFSINDMWIINNQYDQIKDLHQQKKFKFVGYAPMDSYNWLGCLSDTANAWDAIVSYTEFGAHEFVKGGINKPIAVIPHGLTADQFYPKDKSVSRKRLGLADDLFIVLNGNRNQFRKRQDITISAFAKFAVGRPDTRLYLHMGLKDQGWDLMSLFGREMQKNGLDPNGRIIMTADTPNPPNVDVDMLNDIYNVADIGVNTCKGEGWGLVNFEHAACRVAQVVPDHTSCKEIFQGCAPLIRCDHVDVDVNYGREMPCPSDESLAEILEDLYEDKEYRAEVAEKCYQHVTSIQFSWDTIASQFGGIFEDVLNEVDHAVAPPQEEQEATKKKYVKKSKRPKHELVRAS
jgi:glycosyltransferase involved in cell wall biosynthesis